MTYNARTSVHSPRALAPPTPHLPLRTHAFYRDADGQCPLHSLSLSPSPRACLFKALKAHADSASPPRSPTCAPDNKHQNGSTKKKMKHLLNPYSLAPSLLIALCPRAHDNTSCMPFAPPPAAFASILSLPRTHSNSHTLSQAFIQQMPAIQTRQATLEARARKWRGDERMRTASGDEERERHGRGLGEAWD